MYYICIGRRGVCFFGLFCLLGRLVNKKNLLQLFLFVVKMVFSLFLGFKKIKVKVWG